MTERQREEELLSELLRLPENSDEVQVVHGSPSQPVLTRSEEQALLRAANSVGTPTLAPEQVESADDDGPGSFVSDLVVVARKHPVVAALAVAGVVFLVARRRRR